MTYGRRTCQRLQRHEGVIHFSWIILKAGVLTSVNILCGSPKLAELELERDQPAEAKRVSHERR